MKERPNAPKVKYLSRDVNEHDEVPDVSAAEVCKQVMRDQWPNPWSRPEWICLVQPTSPCLRSSSLTAASRLCGENADAVLACSPAPMAIPCGAFYFLRAFVLERTPDLGAAIANGTLDVLWYPLPSDEALDVDSHAQLLLAELILKARG